MVARGVVDGNCLQFGSGGWDLIYWGDPGVRLPPGGVIPICASGFGGVLFRWRTPQGVFLIPSERCPDSFGPPFNASFTEVQPVSDSNEQGYLWVPPQVPGSYWLTSQAPGACEAGVKVRVDVVGPAHDKPGTVGDTSGAGAPTAEGSPSSAAEGQPWHQHSWAHAATAAGAALAAYASLVLPG
ncbi:early nodulin 1 [Micractinium conductrix]|uniref:Early nodulin 1 n=1 Tax=Micractinium conductrix TaxID=554055 RepID=A0A2P6V5K9_9CHLO|nr:early nodulin 1 [Micractinium conductrix]|eukprot:PSC69381.1 early nodulin 1 [Micractinium conductrix]